MKISSQQNSFAGVYSTFLRWFAVVVFFVKTRHYVESIPSKGMANIRVFFQKNEAFEKKG